MRAYERSNLQPPCGDQCGQRGDGGHGEYGETRLVAGGEDQGGDDQGAGQGAKLVEELMQPERRAVAEMLARAGEQCVAGRAAYTLAEPLGRDQCSGAADGSREREAGHREQVQGIAAIEKQPVAVGAVGASPGQPTHGIAQAFGAAPDQSRQHGSGTELVQVGADDAACALVGHVGEQADHAHRDDEAPRGLALRNS